mgnify:FL=1
MASPDVDWAVSADAQEKALRGMDRLAVGGEKQVDIEDPQITAAERSLLQKVIRKSLVENQM